MWRVGEARGVCAGCLLSVSCVSVKAVVVLPWEHVPVGGSGGVVWGVGGKAVKRNSDVSMIARLRPATSSKKTTPSVA